MDFGGIKMLADAGMSKEGLAAIGDLMTHSMDANYETMKRLYEASEKRNTELEAELDQLRLIASRYVRLQYLLRDIVLPETYNP